LGARGLTAHASTFTRRDVLQACCDRLPAGADIAQVEAGADRLLAPATGATVELLTDQAQGRATQASVIRPRDGRIVAVHADERRYSTPELLALEQATITAALSRQHAGIAVADEVAVDAALLRRPTLADEQAGMVHRLCTSGNGVDVVI